jgi:hypothetical protein
VEQGVQLITISAPPVKDHFLIKRIYPENDRDMVMYIQRLEGNIENMVVLKGI